MDNLSDLDDCIFTLEKLQQTLDFETSTIKRNPKINTSPLSSSFIYPKSVHQSEFEAHFTSDIGQERLSTPTQGISKTSILQSPTKPFLSEEDFNYPKSQLEMMDLQSISVRRPKLSSNMSTTDSDLFPVREADSTDFPAPPPPLNVDCDNYLKAYSSPPLQSPLPGSDSGSPIQNNSQSFQFSARKQSTNSLKLSPKPLVDPFLSIQVLSQNSSQSNVSNTPDKESKSLNSFREIAPMSAKEEPSKQTVVRFFTTDKTTKAIVVNEKMDVKQVINILMEKHFWIPSLKSSIVEKVPSLKMERFLEEHENLLACIDSWPLTCNNMIFFEPRDDIYGLFENTKEYLGDNYPTGSMNVDAIKSLFLSVSTDQHEYQDYLYIKKPKENSWKRRFCLLNHHSLSSIQKKKLKSSSTSMVMVFSESLHLYTSTGGWTKQWDAPTPFGFAFKPYSVVDPRSDQIMMFCAGDETSLRRWCSNLRLCKYKNQILNNYQHMQNRSIYCSNLYSKDTQLNRVVSLSPAVASKTGRPYLDSRNSLPSNTFNNGRSNQNKFNF